ncbi:MAG: NAD(P)/FAD-dependent oxidoreductase, partial [Myxococcota bacterium]
MNTYKIAIVGCGSGGAAASALLARLGHEVHLFEAAPKLSAVGAGILLQPTGMFVLQHLGCLSEILAYGAPVERLYSHTRSGRIILDLHYKELDPDLVGLGIHRSVLLHCLEQCIHKAGVQFHLGTTIDALEQSETHTLLLDTDENPYGPFDLVVIADGARSSLRAQLPIPRRVRPYEWGALWCILEEQDRNMQRCLYQILDGTHLMTGFLPTGKNLNKKQMISLFWSLHQSDVQAWQSGGLDAWKEKALYLTPSLEIFVDQLQSLDNFTFARYFDVRMPRWHTTRIVIIGDAAHAMSPQLGQGANLALYDAMVLADCIKNLENIPSALTAYTQRRKHHLRYY